MKISRQDTDVIKGISILLIILHNLTHFLPNAVKENEYSFSLEHIAQYWGRSKLSTHKSCLTSSRTTGITASVLSSLSVVTV